MAWDKFNTKFQQGTYMAGLETAVGLGVVPNMSRGAIIGHATGLAAGAVYDCYENASAVARYPFSTTGVRLQVVSTSANDSAAGSGMRTVRIIGLDTNYNPMTETLTMNGTTPVLSTNTNWLRRNTFIGATCGTPQLGNAGTITLSDAGGANITHIMRVSNGVGNSFGSAAVYTVPDGFSAFINSRNASIEGGATPNAVIALSTCTGGIASGAPWVTSLRLNMTGSTPLQQEISLGLLLPSRSDVSMRVMDVAQNNTEVCVAFQFILVNNTLLV